jgi:hypothetical protein
VRTKRAPNPPNTTMLIETTAAEKLLAAKKRTLSIGCAMARSQNTNAL